MTKDEGLRLALEALEGVLDDSSKVLDASISGGLYEVVQCRDAITAIKAALAAKDEPVACKECHLKDTVYDLLDDLKVANLKLSIRSQRTWVGLTDEDEIDWEEGGNLKDLVKAIEAKLKEKNT